MCLAQDIEPSEPFAPKLVASTGDDYNYDTQGIDEPIMSSDTEPATLPQQRHSGSALSSPSDTGIFKSAHW